MWISLLESSVECNGTWLWVGTTSQRQPWAATSPFPSWGWQSSQTWQARPPSRPWKQGRDGGCAQREGKATSSPKNLPGIALPCPTVSPGSIPQCRDGGCAQGAGKATSSPKKLPGVALSPPRSIPQRPELLPGVGVPHDDTGVVGSGDKERRVRGEVTGHHTALVALQPPDEGVGSHAPQQCLRDTGSGWEHPKG